ncbi:unnamed protein product [Penicillium camemberti]|uniref:Str. FM013 n=1 Tax=Penicillium camemberti (strain FM 013) TaxID=1429867 RepID=A0A0G4PEB3_PENC3|nr:unnamed protein product [Penicillium camemberti]
MTTRVLKPPSLPLEALHGKELDGGGEGKAVAMYGDVERAGGEQGSASF